MKNRKSLRIILGLIMVCLMTYLFGVLTVNADDSISNQKQVLYDQENGLGSSEVNCIYQTQSGYIWIGTDGGLYRYNGSEFRLFNLWNTDKADVYYINSLFQDSKGNLWVSTNNYGLFKLSGGSDVYHFSDEYYKGLKCVNSVCESEDGHIYVATAYGVYTVDSSSEHLIRFEELAKHNVKDMVSTGSDIYGIYNGNTIFKIDSEENVVEVNAIDFTAEEISTISADGKGKIYVGTTGTDILVFDSLPSINHIYSTCDGINKIYPNGDKVYVCTDNGIGYFNKTNEFVQLTNIELDNYISDMLVDYEGNYWFSSNKSGLLYVSKSKFADFNKKYNVNAAATNCFLRVNGFTYIGTDEGLYMLDSKMASVNNELTEYLKGVSIRDIVSDNSGNIWIGTYRRYGVVKYTATGNIDSFSKSTGLLSNLINKLYILNDGNVAIGTEDGISIISKSGKVLKSFSYDSGLEYSNIISLYQDENGSIYAGSDGGGLYIINDDVTTNYTDEDGLTSNVISSIIKGTNGLWIGTNNGLSYYDGTFRTISNIDFSNSIYDLERVDDTLYIVGSKGLLYATEEDLLSTTAINTRYYSSGDGLESSISNSGHNQIYDGVMYLCTNRGVVTFDTNNIEINEVPPKVVVSEVDVDGEKYYYDQLDGTITVPSDTQRIEITFAVLSYSNRENIQVEYQLIGFDQEPDILQGDEYFQAVYTNLDGGQYVFRATAVNGDGVYSENDLQFTIDKKLGFFERTEIRIILICIVAINLLFMLLLILRLWRRFTGKNTELEELAKKHENVVKDNTAKNDYLANMSNEIKLPINAMISNANNILKESENDEETQKKLSEIVEKGNAVIGKVDETILLARLESGAEVANNEPYSVTTLICDISDGMLNKLNNQPIKFLVDLGENIPDILVGDFDKIKTVLEIVLDNSIKYTKEGTISLSVDYYDVQNSEMNSRIVFSVSDTGVGISEERLEHIFEIYYVDESKKTSSTTGTGVSLSIAKMISDILGGELEVESSEGAGATFTFSLVQEKPDVSGNMIPINENTIERVSREEAERMWVPDLSVLLVDDVELSRSVSEDVIKSMEIKCDTAESGVSAIDMVMTNHYDIVFMDIAMPVMNGIDALHEIRELSDTYYSDLTVVAMTEDVIGKNRQELIDEGFSDVILKPFDITVLASVINRFVDKEKIKYKTNDVAQYIAESRYSEGLRVLEDYFDVAGVLERIGGNIEVYNKILTTFYNQNKDSEAELKSKMGNDYRGFRNKIHSIRTGCQNIGAVDAADIALRIENALNLGNKAYIRNNINLVYDCISVINELIENYMIFVDKEKGQSDKENAEKHAKRLIKENVSSEETENASQMEEEASENENYQVVEEAAEELEVADDEKYSDIINIDMLKNMKQATFAEDIDRINQVLESIKKHEYGAEDQDFIKALESAIEKKDFIEVDDLLNTYIDLKSGI